MTPRKINLYMITNLPSVYICGVRVKELDANFCKTGVSYKWINKNPFKSMFWAVQGMAAELSTGALVMQHIEASKKNVSMLLLNTKATFLKKAKGKIIFTCEEGEFIKDAIKQTIANGEGATCWMKSVGTNEMGEKVSEFYFEWTVRLRK